MRILYEGLSVILFHVSLLASFLHIPSHFLLLLAGIEEDGIKLKYVSLG
jgi:hypothetical protein